MSHPKVPAVGRATSVRGVGTRTCRRTRGTRSRGPSGTARGGVVGLGGRVGGLVDRCRVGHHGVPGEGVVLGHLFSAVGEPTDLVIYYAPWVLARA